MRISSISFVAKLILIGGYALAQTTFKGSWRIGSKLAKVPAVHAALVDQDTVHFIGYNYLNMDDGGRENKKVESFKWRTEASTILVQSQGMPGCSSGGFLADGSMILLGAATAQGEKIKKFKSGDANYNENFDMIDTFRWYAGSVTTPNGNLIVIGGALANSPNADQMNDSYEFIGQNGSYGKKVFQFLRDHQYCDYKKANCGLYPPTFLLPTGDYFVMADQSSIIWNPFSNTVVKDNIKDIPQNHYTYPYNGIVVMLPLSPTNDYKPVILACGGNPSSAGPPSTMRLASSACYRIEPLTQTEWVLDDPMPVKLTIPTSTLLADGTILVSGGALKGEGGTGVHESGLQYNKGDVSSGNANFDPFIYNPRKPRGQRWSAKLQKSTIARVYHSSALLLPNAKVLVMGSQPNQYASKNFKPFPTEYRYEYFTPPYLKPGKEQPVISSISSKSWGLNQQITFVSSQLLTKALMIHQGISTHSMNFAMRGVYLKLVKGGDSVGKYLYTVTTPRDNKVAPIGKHYYLFVTAVGGVPSAGVRVSISGPVV